MVILCNVFFNYKEHIKKVENNTKFNISNVQKPATY